MIPKDITLKNNELIIEWNDEKQSIYPLKYLRDECPCANCKGETILFQTMRPVKVDKVIPEMFIITNIELVGNYALSIHWKDGHDTGIYSWEYLMEIADKNSSNQDYKPLI